jgi:hypothetical protein
MKYKFLLFFLIILAFLFSLPLIFKPMNTEADAYVRSNIAKEMQNKNIFIETEVNTWLPLHTSILSLSLYIYNNPLLIPRLLTLIFSTGSIILIFYYSQILGLDKKTSSTAALLAAIFPLRYYFSTTTLTEPVFSFFFIFALILLFKPKPQYFLGMIFLNISHGIRYDSWLLLPLIWLLLIFKKTKVKKIVLFPATIIFPVIWMAISYMQTGNPIIFFQTKYSIAQHDPPPEFGNLILASKVWIESLMSVYPLVLILVFILGLYIFIKNSGRAWKKILSIIPVYLFILLIFQVYIGSMEWYPPRYLYLSIILSLPFVSYCLLFLYKQAKIKLNKLSFSILIILIFFLFCLSYPSLLLSTKGKAENWWGEKTMSEALSLSEKITQLKADNYYYLYKNDRLYFDPIIEYFSNIRFNSVAFKESQKKVPLLNSKTLIIWENNQQNKTYFSNQCSLYFKNASFTLCYIQ